MNRETGRPSHITDVLNTYGYAIGETPFGYGKNEGGRGREQTYENLEMYGGLAKPSKSDLVAGLVLLQAEWDEANAPWKLARKRAYSSIEDQLDMLGKDLEDGGTRFKDHRRDVKTRHRRDKISDF